MLMSHLNLQVLCNIYWNSQPRPPDMQDQLYFDIWWGILTWTAHLQKYKQKYP